MAALGAVFALAFGGMWIAAGDPQYLLGTVIFLISGICGQIVIGSRR